MRKPLYKRICFGILILILLAGCSPAFAQTPVPIAATATLTPMPTNTPTATPTITPTATATATPTPAMVTIQAGQVTAPILLYHHISTEVQDSRYYIDPAKFDEQMKWLFDNGYQTITVSQLENLIYNGGQLPQRPVIITFDDGNADNYNLAFPILKKYGFVATFYVVQSYINGDGMITTDQLKELIQNGWEIGCHSKTHAHLTSGDTDLAQELRMSKLKMEEELGVPINSFSYPFGEESTEVVRLVSSYGYTSAVGLSESITHTKNNIYYLSRIEIQNEYSMEKFESYFPWSGPLN